MYHRGGVDRPQPLADPPLQIPRSGFRRDQARVEHHLVGRGTELIAKLAALQMRDVGRKWRLGRVRHDNFSFGVSECMVATAAVPYKPTPFVAAPLALDGGVAQICAMATFNPKPDIASPDMFLTGQLLIAMPSMADPRFQQSVIYVCAHTPEGAMGLVLNRPIVKPTFDDLLKQLQVAPVPPVREIKLCAGGPVEMRAALSCTPATGPAKAA